MADEVVLTKRELNLRDPLCIPSEIEIRNYNAIIRPKLFQLAIMVRDGEKEEDILEFLGISKTTLYRYKRYFPELRNAISEGKISFTERAEKALNDLARGMHYEEVETTDIYKPDEDNPDMKIVSRKVRKSRKYIPPNFKAIEMILTNKDSENWKKQVTDNPVQNNNIVQINVSDDDLKSVMDRMNSLSR